MQDKVLYNGIIYSRHPKQKYFYCAERIFKRLKFYSRSLHRQMWFDAHGEIPKGFQVHHKDGNAYNNTLENLEIVERSKHLSEHQKQRVKENPEFFIDFQKKGIKLAPAWHSSPEGKAWHSQHSIKNGFNVRPLLDFECEQCNAKFKSKQVRARFCTNKCKSAWRRKTGIDNIIKNCKICSKEFTSNKYDKAECCSRKCTTSYQRVI